MKSPCRSSALLACVLLAWLGSWSIARAEPRDEWAQEILLQLSELRKAQGELRQQLRELQAEVAALEAAQPGASRRMKLDESYPALGAADAAVAIVEFSDFECPYCRRHHQGTLPALLRQYVDSGRARYYYLDYPLSFHARAEGAAVAAACAHRQGKFWPMHDLLFANQGKLGPELYAQLAAELGLDAVAFESCNADPALRGAVQDRVALGDQFGVQGTPAFLVGQLENGVLVNPQLLSGARPLADFARAIERLLPRE